MATGETGIDDVSFDLISVQYHSLKAGHDYGQYVRDAENAGHDEIAAFTAAMTSSSSSASPAPARGSPDSACQESGDALTTQIGSLWRQVGST